MSGFYDENGCWRSAAVSDGGRAVTSSQQAATDAQQATRRVLEGQSTARVELPRLLRQHPALKVDVNDPETERHPLAELAGLYAKETLY